MRYHHPCCCFGFWKRQDDGADIETKTGNTMKRERESGERMVGQQFRYNRDGEEWEEVGNILFHLRTSVDHKSVDPPPPLPQM